jgi:large subunit ribosomal protein L28
MPRCELTGKQPEVKNLVSHSNIKTKSVALPNVQQKRLFSTLLGEMVNLKLAASTIRSIDHVGSFDKFVLNQSVATLSKRAQTLRTRMLRKLRGQTASKKSAKAKAEPQAKQHSAPQAKQHSATKKHSEKK